jgi:hypothetical protein
MAGGKNNRASSLSLIRQSEELIKSFNPTINSIDDHLSNEIGDTSDVSKTDPDLMFIQQVVTGWLREKKVLDAFISNFYADNGARITRTDMLMYTILAYLAVFRMKEIGFGKFKHLAKDEDPSKVGVFVEYLFNKEVLDSSLRASWMAVVDLTYTENTLIASIAKFIPQAEKYLKDLAGAANEMAAAEAAKEAAKADGTAGLKQAMARSLTRPQSPKLSRPRPFIMPEPIKIEQAVKANEIPGNLNNNTIKGLKEKGSERRERIRTETMKQYTNPKNEFKFGETKRGRPIEELRKEMEETRAKELDFDATFVHEPPNFDDGHAVVRVNAATILREDFLYRKQQAKDAKLLKNYEEELRDPVTYFAWQQKNKERDAQDKLEQVALRREQAKQGSIEAAKATQTLLNDNRTLAKLVRAQADAIKEKKTVEYELETLNKQTTVSKIIEVRDVAPRKAVEKVLKTRIADGAKARESMDVMLAQKEKEDKIAEDELADRIRQLRATNEVHRDQIKVFDPTQSSNKGFLDEMSYMEMKERQSIARNKREVDIQNKRDDILEAKQKKSRELERRARSVVSAREVRNEAFKLEQAAVRESALAKSLAMERMRETAAKSLDAELRGRREATQAERAALKEEQERIKRAQAYMGANAGQKEEFNQKQLLMARERNVREIQTRNKAEAILLEECKDKGYKNRNKVIKETRTSKAALMAEKEALVRVERREATRKIKEEVMDKKAMAATSRMQAERTQKVRHEFNPYAESMRGESVELGRTYAQKQQYLRSLDDTRFH